MSDLVGNPEDRFSQNEAHIVRDFTKTCDLIAASFVGVIN